MSDYVEGDIGVSYEATCRRADETIIDLTGRTVVLCFRINNGESGIGSGTGNVVKRRTMTVESPATAGNVIYTFASGDLSPSGIMTAEVEIRGGGSGSIVISGSNDQIPVNLGLSTFSVTVANATYTDLGVLAAECEAALDPGWPGVDFTVTYDPGTGLFTISSNTSHQLQFSQANVIAAALGFPASDTPFALSHMGTTPIFFNSNVMTSKDPKQYTIRARV